MHASLALLMYEFLNISNLKYLRICIYEITGIIQYIDLNCKASLAIQYRRGCLAQISGGGGGKFVFQDCKDLILNYILKEILHG